MNLEFPDGSPFSTGSCRYLDHIPGGDSGHPRIYIDVEIHGQRTLAAVDTGGVYVICDPHLASIIDFSAAEFISIESVSTWNRKYNGKLYRLPLAILADEGETLVLDVTVFIPDDLGPDEPWPFPTAIIGYSGGLERLRFAVSPAHQPDSRFFFGPV